MATRSGRLIVIDGIDQSGKRTQTQILANKMRRAGRRVSIWNFPDYTTPLGRQLKWYLSGRKRFDFHAIHLLYAANKWERAALIAHELESGFIVIANRYTPSNVAYGVAHGLSLSWLESLESDLPKADLVLLLDVSPKASFKRKSKRRDVHEENLAYLRKVRRIYLQLAKRHRWKVINGEQGSAAVGNAIWSCAMPLLHK